MRYVVECTEASTPSRDAAGSPAAATAAATAAAAEGGEAEERRNGANWEWTGSQLARRCSKQKEMFQAAKAALSIDGLPPMYLA